MPFGNKFADELVLPCKPIFQTPTEVLFSARASAVAGKPSPAAVKDLADPGPETIQRRLNWTLRFPLTSPYGRRLPFLFIWVAYVFFFTV